LFSYGGGTTWSPIRATVDSAIQKALPDFKLRYTDPLMVPPGSAMGLKMLLDDQLAFAQSANSLAPEDYQAAIKRGYRLNPVPVAIDAVVFVVNPSLKISGITLDQVRDIYQGKITNWQDIGGPDLAITPFSRSIESGGTVIELQRQILADQPFGKTVQFVRNTTQALRLVNKTPGGIYYGSAATVIGQCSVQSLPLGRNAQGLVSPYRSPYVPSANCPQQRNQINVEAIRSGQYPFTRRLFVVIKQNGQLDQQAGQAYANLLLSAQGQNLLQEAGFVNLR
jgi:phosphate transport system substrate-binding protein